MCPKPSVIMKRFKFNSRFKQPSESVATFIAGLCKLAEHCVYGAQLSDMLRDRLVCGIDDKKMQARLLADGDLDFAKAEATVLMMEAAARDIHDLQHAGEQQGRHVNKDQEWRSEERNEDSQRKQFRSRHKCYRCGGQHMAHDCRFVRSTCYACKKVGNLAKVCRSEERKNSKMHKVEESEDEEGIGSINVEEYAMYNLRVLREPSVIVHPRLNKTTVPMEVDTGVATSILSKKAYDCS